MNTRRELPAELRSGPFSVATALEQGVAEHRLRARDLETPFWGVRDHRGPVSLQESCRALSTRFRPGDAFAGSTAAVLWGMPLPSRLATGRPLVVSSRHPVHPMRRRGVVGTSRTDGDVVERAGVAVLTPLATCLSLARELARDDLTAVIDFLITGDGPAGFPLVRTDALTRFMDASAHAHGIERMRAAAIHSRPGSWSRPETLLRLLVVRAGLPVPALNTAVMLSGSRVIPDLSWPEFRVALEYNGAHHDGPDRRVRDLRRVDLFTDDGWLTVNVARDELFGRPLALVDRIAQRLRAHGWVGRVRALSPISVAWRP